MSEQQYPSRLASLVLVLAINAAALWASAGILGGFDIGGIGSLIGVAFIFAVVNAVLKPIANFISFPLTILTLGLITLVTNGLLLLLTAWVGEAAGLDVSLHNVLDAILAALIVSVVSWLLSTFVGRPVRWTAVRT
jgi:putative membrane protein